MQHGKRSNGSMIRVCWTHPFVYVAHPLAVADSALPSQRQAPAPEQDTSLPSPIPSERATTTEHGNSPSLTQAHSPSQSSNSELVSPRVAASSSADNMGLPPHPWPPAPLAPGVDARSPKLANRAYDSVVSGMLVEAQHKYECLVFTEGAYPDLHTQIRWSFECWEAICSKCYERSPSGLEKTKNIET